MTTSEQKNLTAWEQHLEHLGLLEFDQREVRPTGYRIHTATWNGFELEYTGPWNRYCQRGVKPFLTPATAREYLALVQAELETAEVSEKQRQKLLHSDACWEMIQKREQARANWRAQWPNFCQACGGTGQFTERFDPSPAGVSLGSGFMVDVDPCESCVLLCICPRCGNMDGLSGDGEGPCTSCGWNYDDCLPHEAECCCW